MCVCVGGGCFPACVSMYHVHAMSIECRKERQIPQDWSYSQL